jgi:hypothetical protein
MAGWEHRVIGSGLAVDLFLTDNALGRTLTFNGRECTVCGVYSLPTTLLARVSQTTDADIFLPLESYPDRSAGISEFMVGLKGVPSIADIKAELDLKLDIRLTFRSAYNFNETRRLALQSENIQGLLCALAFCLLSGWWAARLAMGLVKALKTDAYRDVLAGHTREVSFCISALLCFAAGVFWVCNCAFTLFLPQDLIINSGSIADYIIGNFQLGNMKSDVFLCEFSSKVKTALAALDICIAVLLLKLVYKVKRAIDDLQNAGPDRL